jgi:hypothetical protein
VEADNGIIEDLCEMGGMQAESFGWTRVGFLIAFLFFASDQALSQEIWQRLRLADGRFSIEMPDNAEHIAEQKPVANTTYISHRYVAKSGDLTFIVFSGVYPESVDFSNTRKILEAGVAAVARKSAIKNLSWIKIQGFEASDMTSVREQRIESRSIALFAGYAGIQATVAGPLGSSVSAEAKRFLDSLKIDAGSSGGAR